MENVGRAAVVYHDGSRGRLAAKLLALCRDNRKKKSVIGVFPECGEQYAERTEELFRYSLSIGANLTVLYSTQPAAALLEYIRSNAVTDVIISEKDTCGAGRLVTELLPRVNVTYVPTDGTYSFFNPDLLYSPSLWAN